MEFVLQALVLMASTGNTWPQYGADLLNDHWSTGTANMSTEPDVKWISVQGFWEAYGAAIADVDGDGETEVLINNANDPDSGGLYCFNGDDGSIEWTYLVSGEHGIYSVPAVGDVDGDGDMEVLFNDSLTLYCLEGNGTLKWSRDILDNNTGQASPVIADVNDDGHMEVLMQRNDSVFCLSGSDGNTLWTHSPSSYACTPAVVDLDGDGNTDVVVHTGTRVECLNGSDGSVKWSSYDLIGNIYYFSSSSPVVADVNGDGRLEVISSTRGQGDVYCFSDTGDTLWKAHLTSLSGNEIQTPAVADLDGDGSVEIVALSEYDKTVYCLNGSDGSVKWTQLGEESLHRGCSVVDIDSDSKLEILLPSHHGSLLRCLNGEDGSILWDKVLSTSIDLHEPVVGDIDDDGELEIVVGTALFVYALDLIPAYGGTDEGKTFPAFELTARNQEIYLHLPVKAQISLDLYDASGRVVQNLFNGVLGPGAHTFTPKIETRGVYTAVLRYHGKSKSVKIVR